MEILFELTKDIKIISVPRRIYFKFPFNREIKDRLKRLGANWDPDEKGWWMGKGASNTEKAVSWFQQKTEEVYGSSKNYPETVFRASDDIQIVETQRRYEFHFPFDRDLKDRLKKMGARWDGSNKIWYMNKGARNLDKAVDSFKSHAEELIKKQKRKREFIEDVERRRKSDLAISIPYDFRHVAKDKGGIWDKENKVWLMPDRTSKREVLEHIEAERQKKREQEEQRRKREIFKEVQRNINREINEDDIEKLSFSDRSQRGAPYVGQVFRSRKLNRVVEVAYVSKPERVVDGRSFGYNFDDGWAWTAYVVPASGDDTEQVEQDEDQRLQKREALREADDLERLIKQRGSIPEGLHNIPGEPLAVRGKDTMIVGGGSWFKIDEADNAIWYIRNNGADGDDWGRNNVQTGGAGAIGWKMKYDESVADKIRSIDKTLDRTKEAQLAKKVAHRYAQQKLNHQ